ncbi:pyruvate, phosphate dikinase [Methyloceanibacter methanicus]|uniref:Pyruvate, phosphate dikinase n=1 Tax=Methyloceanibacter methanicus TaxID=1774968 RepID=A0A1E3W4J4_9HYPH|nr:pyruvate, phosphate dikinase [Methyloceanibacter methanicus]ODS00723.1 pyruvate, phosphate dikinase [Methyloceanibacter methanicus]
MADQAPKWVYSFGGGRADGSAADKDRLGGKGAHLAEMSRIGLPVPPGFTIATDVCAAYYENGRRLPEELKPMVDEALVKMAAYSGAHFGDVDHPLLVSVRSGARAPSMPGMMDTVLNLGLNDETVEGLARRTGDRRFAYDTYRRFIQMYADVVLGLDHGLFEDILENYKALKGFELDPELQADDWIEIVGRYKGLVEKELTLRFPQSLRDQLWGAISAVFGSWQNARAIAYRRLHDIPDDWGTAVTVQTMVFGNKGDNSATGVVFTRNPSTGVNELFGEFLLNAQGEDVVAGLRTPQPLTERAGAVNGNGKPSLEALMPDAFAKLKDACAKLERHFRDLQDIEFTVEAGELFMLQTRAGKRSTQAALKIAVDMADEGIITKEEAVERINPAQLDQLLHPTLDPNADMTVLVKGLPASPGAASGEIVFDADEAVHMKSQGHTVILARIETSPEDVQGMHASAGVLTTRGGMTSHAAVVARGDGPSVRGRGRGPHIDLEHETLEAGGIVLHKGDVVTIDGSSGKLIKGRVTMRQPELSEDFSTLMHWADGLRRMEVRANADTPADARHARDFGAEGIGLCRTEHMFFQDNRIVAMREMILAETKEARRAALADLLPAQRQDFIELFEIMAGLPVTIRLFDPPLHEFLPNEEDAIADVAESMGVSIAQLKRRIGVLREFNPMLGQRGARLLVTYPEIVDMQARAIFEAAIETGKELHHRVRPEIMVPLVATKRELDLVKERITVTARAGEGTRDERRLEVGSMIELPRACLVAGEIAEAAEFFSFGTNDLTQTTFGLSRDDAGRFLGEYADKGIINHDPFMTLDNAVGELMEIGVERGRAVRPDLKIGVCGEHGGDPETIGFCEQIGLTYVSCSPYRVPVARLAAAQAALKKQAVTDR